MSAGTNVARPFTPIDLETVQRNLREVMTNLHLLENGENVRVEDLIRQARENLEQNRHFVLQDPGQNQDDRNIAINEEDNRVLAVHLERIPMYDQQLQPAAADEQQARRQNPVNNAEEPIFNNQGDNVEPNLPNGDNIQVRRMETRIRDWAERYERDWVNFRQNRPVGDNGFVRPNRPNNVGILRIQNNPRQNRAIGNNFRDMRLNRNNGGNDVGRAEQAFRPRCAGNREGNAAPLARLQINAREEMGVANQPPNRQQMVGNMAVGGRWAPVRWVPYQRPAAPVRHDAGLEQSIARLQERLDTLEGRGEDRFRHLIRTIRERLQRDNAAIAGATQNANNPRRDPPQNAAGDINRQAVDLLGPRRNPFRLPAAAPTLVNNQQNVTIKHPIDAGNSRETDVGVAQNRTVEQPRVDGNIPNQANNQQNITIKRLIDAGNSRETDVAQNRTVEQPRVDGNIPNQANNQQNITIKRLIDAGNSRETVVAQNRTVEHPRVDSNIPNQANNQLNITIKRLIDARNSRETFVVQNRSVEQPRVDGNIPNQAANQQNITLKCPIGVGNSSETDVAQNPSAKQPRVDGNIPNKANNQQNTTIKRPIAVENSRETDVDQNHTVKRPKVDGNIQGTSSDSTAPQPNNEPVAGGSNNQRNIPRMAQSSSQNEIENIPINYSEKNKGPQKAKKGKNKVNPKNTPDYQRPGPSRDNLESQISRNTEPNRIENRADDLENNDQSAENISQIEENAQQDDDVIIVSAFFPVRIKVERDADNEENAPNNRPNQENVANNRVNPPVLPQNLNGVQQPAPGPPPVELGLENPLVAPEPRILRENGPAPHQPGRGVFYARLIMRANAKRRGPEFPGTIQHPSLTMENMVAGLTFCLEAEPRNRTGIRDPVRAEEDRFEELQLKMMQTYIKLRKELREVIRNSERLGIQTYKVSDQDHYIIIIFNLIMPPGTPYDGGEIGILIKINPTDLDGSPQVSLTKRIWHPNMCPFTGRVLSNRWDNLTIFHILAGVRRLLIIPELENNVHAVVAKQFRTNREVFRKTAQHWMSVYDSPRSDHLAIPEYTEILERFVEEEVPKDRALHLLSKNNWDIDRAMDEIS